MQQGHSPSPKDTQVASQWVYNDLTTLNDESQAGDSMGAGFAAYEGTQNGRRSRTPEVLPPAVGATQEEDEEDILSQDIRAEIYPESKRFQFPKTPASQSRKRKRGSPAISSDSRTPSLPINPFASRAAAETFMGPSQLFQITQAQTSPPIAGVEGSSDRPSPDLHNLQRQWIATESSPMPLPNLRLNRGLPEPQTTYVSLKESQEARERRRLEEMELSPDELSDDGFSQPDSIARQTYLRAERSRIAHKQLGGLTQVRAPPSETRRRGGRVEEKTNSSPVQSIRRPNQVFLLSDDPPPENLQGSITEEETDREDDVDEKTGGADADVTEENKENIEVPMTGSRDQGNAARSVTQSSPLNHTLRRSTRVVRASQPKVNSISTANGSETPSTQSQLFAVADSQPSRKERTASPLRKLRQASHGPGSSDSSHDMVPQSQIPGSIEHTRQGPTSTNGVVDPWDAEAAAISSNELIKHSIANAPSKSFAATSAAAARPRGGFVLSTSSDRSLHDAQSDQPSSDPQIPTSSNEVEIVSPPTSHHSISSTAPRSATRASGTSGPHASAIGASTDSTPFETAREKTNETPTKSRIRAFQQQIGSSSGTPTKSPSQRMRTLQEIAAHSSFSDINNSEDFNINLLGDDDHQFLQAMSDASSAKSTPKISRVLKKLAARESSNLNDECRRAVREPQLPSKSPTAPEFSQLTPPDSSFNDELGHDHSLEKDVPSPRINKAAQRKTAKPTSKLQITPSIAPGSRSAALTSEVDSATRKSVERSSSDSVIVAPNRVFAHFNGNDSAYYPALCKDILPNKESRYQVKYDDGNHSVVNSYGIKRLELRPGDLCKVDKHGQRGKNFIIQGLRKVQADDDNADSFPQELTDIYGHNAVAVITKHRLSSVGVGGQDPQELVVPIVRIYFTQTMWGHIKDREYTFTPSNTTTTAHPGSTPSSSRPSTPATPPSRSRRGKSSLSNIALPNPPSSASLQIFHNMAFTLTNLSSPSSTSALSSQLTAHGATILDSGFDTLFSVPSPISSSSSSFSATGDPTTTTTTTTTAPFALQPDFASLGFVALISDRHSRKIKYIQALALGIPALSSRWVSDSIALGSPQPLHSYLLPAGESSYLGGAVRSRVFASLPDPRTTTLAEMLDARDVMIQGGKVVLVVRKGEESVLQHHTFLLHAMGAKEVVKVGSVEGAARVLREEKGGCEWVVSYDKEREVEKAVLGGSGRKGRRMGKDVGGGGAVRVVGNEFVVQSLILGRLID